MSFLTPLFLLGALGVTLPVLFHLIRRTTRERTIFSSLMFLMPSPPRLTRRSRLEHILLLILRCGVLCLLALGFARPFWKKPLLPPPGQTARRVLVLVDTSASMRRAGLWADAAERLGSILRGLSPVDQAALFTFDRQLTPLFTFEQWNGAPLNRRASLMKARLAETSPGWAATHLDTALINAAEMLAELSVRSTAAQGQVVVISDLHEGSRLDALQGYEWPKGVELAIETLKPKHLSDASLELLADAADADPKSADSVRVRVSNAGQSKIEEFRLGWAGEKDGAFIGKPNEAYVPAGQSRIIPLPLGSAEGATKIMLQGDEENFDNTVYVVPPARTKLSILYWGSESPMAAKQPLYFLERAFQETRRQSVEVLPRRPGAPLTAADCERSTLSVISDSLGDGELSLLHDYVLKGKTVLCLLRTASMAPTLARLAGVERVSAEEARVSNYAMLVEVDLRHALFAPFADPRYSDFTKIHFWKYRRLNLSELPGARVVARFDAGDPALLELPVGRGRMLVLTSGWDPADSQLALSTKFVPLLFSLLEYCGAPLTPVAQYHVGDPVPIQLSDPSSAAGLTITSPDGRQERLARGQTNYTGTALPGIYTVAGPQAGAVSHFGVNLDSSEGRTTPLPVDEFQRLGAPLTASAIEVARQAERKLRLQNAELEARQRLWRWFLLATLGLALLETWMAGRALRRPTAAPAAVDSVTAAVT